MMPLPPIKYAPEGLTVLLRELMHERDLMLTELARELHKSPLWVDFAVARQLWAEEVTKQDIQRLAEVTFPNDPPPKALEKTIKRCRINYGTLADS